MNLIINTDGGARGNPGPAAIGIVMKDGEGKHIKSIKEYIGETTNNQAEYKALLRALNEAMALKAENLVCHLDSELVVKQLTGLYKIKEAGLQGVATEILKLTKQFKQVQFKHVRREYNSDADKLVNEALDEQTKNP